MCEKTLVHVLLDSCLGQAAPPAGKKAPRFGALAGPAGAASARKKCRVACLARELRSSVGGPALANPRPRP
jgi:hypothetical protein